jgi:hypothetical protein
MRRLLALLLFVGGPVLYLSRRRERGAPEAERLLAVARSAL